MARSSPANGLKQRWHHLANNQNQSVGWWEGSVHAATHSHEVGVFLWDPWRHLLSRSTNGQPEILNMERMIITSFSSLEYSQRLVVTLVWQYAVLGLHTKPPGCHTKCKLSVVAIRLGSKMKSEIIRFPATKTRCNFRKPDCRYCRCSIRFCW